MIEQVALNVSRCRRSAGQVAQRAHHLVQLDDIEPAHAEVLLGPGLVEHSFVFGWSSRHDRSLDSLDGQPP
ncbi:hypothetical protein APT59_16045 [Pseudomonas oryzihabitans]|uniref:Uncharacterized protein n=1 Tax=Pseudomonas oryzihabitans TaxID=47885 RepID=A0A0U4WSB7_9PSED|nr:hypothetical protein APT59_16045 [Pseudomonas oryzihabitans]